MGFADILAEILGAAAGGQMPSPSGQQRPSRNPGRSRPSDDDSGQSSDGGLGGLGIPGLPDLSKIPGFPGFPGQETEPAAQPQPSRERSNRGQRSAPHPALPELPSRVSDAAADLPEVMHAVVQVVALRQGFMGGMQSAWTGSGTIIHPSGLILTNCHVADPRRMGMSSPPADLLAIAITEEADSPPALTYRAEVIAADPDLDLAVLRILGDLKGRPVSGLKLPYLDLGDSDQLKLGEKISIFGYPGIGGETVTFTAGNVSGFTREDGVSENRAWIKTDATIAGGNSGGTAVNGLGHLIGVPTQAAAGSNITPVDARPVLDTNNDGRIDQRDTPMAIGGFINGLRPVKLALPLLREAGFVPKIASPTAPSRPSSRSLPSDDQIPVLAPSTPRVHPAELADFSNLLFCARITADNRPISPSSHLPSGLDTVYATFEHDNLRPGTPWSLTWMKDEQIIIQQDGNWDGEDDGRKSVKISNRKGLPDGAYHLILSIAGRVELEGDVLVGSSGEIDGTLIRGQLSDASTGDAVTGALVVVLRPGASVRDFLHSQDDDTIQAKMRSEADGSFALDEPLAKGQSYSLIVAGRGYKLVAVEGALRLSTGAPSQADIGMIELQPE